eukprot:TRINITY_DN1454_c0_g1_i1.p1 TRINITY_DN1454_c0_g1~~TRINITY_DN1454_c0_g1_i1.p1  ORF type:complete len:349 (-),score=80.30 TRINITY_DN1454_c0_g1_i1:78-1124(-)
MYSTEVGFVAVFLAILFFGSYAVPLKFKRVRVLHIDPMVTQLYMGFMIFFTSWLVALYEEFEFTFYGILGAILWVPANVFAIFAIRLIGLSVAQGLWCGFTIAVSFFWGAVVFQDHLTNVYLALLGLAFLIGGCLILTQIRTNEPPEDEIGEIDESTEASTPLQDGKHSLPSYDMEEVQSIDPSHVAINSPSETEKTSKQTKKTLGMICVCCVGLLNGSMMVPARLNPQKSLIYVVSFGIGVFFVTPILFALYFIIKRERPKIMLRRASGPSLIVGLLWNVGNVCATIAVLSPLGLTVGFPLTQVALLVAGLWGMYVFHEISGKRNSVTFFAGAGIILLGAALLSFFG